MLCKYGNEQSGVYQVLTSYLTSRVDTLANIKWYQDNPLTSLRSNRFNILFMMLECSTTFQILSNPDIWQTPNQLLRAVYSDIQVPEFLAGCRALGLINKKVTGLLQRVFESSDISITEINDIYQSLVSCIE